MDKFEVAAERISDREMCPHDYFVVRAVVNGTIYGEPDYILNIDNFFEALEADEAVIQFVGGCLDPKCCAIGAWTRFTAEAWIWNHSSTFDWTEVITSAEWLISFIEHSTVLVCGFEDNKPNLPKYRQNLENLKKRLQADTVKKGRS